MRIDRRSDRSWWWWCLSLLLHQRELFKRHWHLRRRAGPCHRMSEQKVHQEGAAGHESSSKKHQISREGTTKATRHHHHYPDLDSTVLLSQHSELSTVTSQRQASQSGYLSIYFLVSGMLSLMRICLKIIIKSIIGDLS